MAEEMGSSESRSDSAAEKELSNTGAWRARALSADECPAGQLTDGVLEHRVDWLWAQCDRPDKTVLILEDGRHLPIPLFVHDGEVDFNLGEVSVAHAKVRRYVLVGNFQPSSVADWLEPLIALACAIPPNAAVFLLGVVQGEGLDGALTERRLRKHFFVLQQGGSYKRRLCALSEGFEAYLGSLSANSRKSMKRSLKRFETEFAGRFALEAHQDPISVGELLDRVEVVSRRTYQGRMLGLAVTRDGFIGNKTLEGARLGYTRCYLLTIDEKPVAWRIGLVTDGVFCSHHVGYDPDFEEWHPGVLMHLYSIRHMIDVSKDVTLFDFLYGDNDFKRRASNRSRDERNFYLFPRTPRGALTYASLALCNSLSGTIGRLLERAGLKARLKAFLRRG